MADVFVSYAAEDGEVARYVARGLKNAGYDVWNYLDDGQIAGEEYVDNIMKHVKASRAVVLFVSEAALRSVQCDTEAQLAWQMEKVVIPLLSGMTFPELEQKIVDGKEKGARWAGRIGTRVTIAIDSENPQAVLDSVLTSLRATVRPSRAPAGRSAPVVAPAPVQRASTGGALLATIVGAVGVLYNLFFLKVLFTPPATPLEHQVRSQFRLALTTSILVNLAGLAQNGALLYGAGLLRKKDPRGAPLIRTTALTMLATIGIWAIVNLMSFSSPAAAAMMNSADLVQTTLATAAIALFPAALVFWVFRHAKR